jgi:hypothetical protein
VTATAIAAGASAGSAGASGAAAAGLKTNFFVTSDKSKTGNLGGLSGADARCSKLAQAAGFPAKTWVAYLSVEHDAAHGNMPVNARDRIGSGPWFNAKGIMLAADLAALHALKGNVDVFLDEKGQKVPGNWSGSPQPIEHDVLTGTSPDGMLLTGQTCADWTSEASGMAAMVGHTDGLGPGGDGTGMYASWNSSHANGGCNDTAPRGGAGRLYCFGLP